jgi:signal peptidase I
LLPRKTPPPENKDGVREIIETVVFVVVLVLLLKTFLAEAFVIPTGSMATTLLGYHKEVTCEQCKYRFKVNASDEAEDRPNRPPDRVVEGICPNCRFHNHFPEARREGNAP